jgi:hypothetical protein
MAPLISRLKYTLTLDFATSTIRTHLMTMVATALNVQTTAASPIRTWTAHPDKFITVGRWSAKLASRNSEMVPSHATKLEPLYARTQIIWQRRWSPRT